MLSQRPEYPASKISEFLEWICTIPYRIRHRRISEDRSEGTGEYRNWKSSVPMLLRLPGTRKSLHTFSTGRTIVLTHVHLAGAGKPTSHQASSIYLFRIRLRVVWPTSTCDRAEENRRSQEEILSALVQQLAQTSEAGRRYLRRAAERKSKVVAVGLGRKSTAPRPTQISILGRRFASMPRTKSNSRSG